jgi:hypothetical protein
LHMFVWKSNICYKLKVASPPKKFFKKTLTPIIIMNCLWRCTMQNGKRNKHNAWSNPKHPLHHDSIFFYLQIWDFLSWSELKKIFVPLNLRLS